MSEESNYVGTQEECAQHLFRQSAWYLGGAGWLTVGEAVREEYRDKARKDMRGQLRHAVQAAMHHAAALRDLDTIIKLRIDQIEKLLFRLDAETFTSGDYGYVCRKGQWRFERTADQRPVRDLCRDDRCEFLRGLKIPKGHNGHTVC